MSDDIVNQPEQEIDFVEYLRLWASPDSNDQAIRALHKAADEIERLRAEVERLTAGSRFVDEVYLLTEEGIKLWDKIQAVRGEQ